MQIDDSSEQVLGKTAELYENLLNGKIKCTACARYCEIPEGRNGLCGIRGVKSGRLQLFVYGKIIAGHVDPIEKNQLLTICPEVTYFRLQPQDATGYVNTVKIMIFLKEEK